MKFNNDDFIFRAKKIHNDDFDYSLTEYKNMNSKVIITCKKCGKDFSQRASHHLNGCGCMNCFLIKQKKNQPKNKEDFIKKANLVHNLIYDYSNSDYVDFFTKISIFCKKCNKYFLQSPNIHLNGCGCQSCGRISHKKKLLKTNEEYIAAVKKKHNVDGEPLFDYSKTKYIGSKYSIIVICKRCGIEFSQRAGNHLNGNGCKQCVITDRALKQRSNTYDFIRKSKIIHSTPEIFDYKDVNYVSNSIKVKIHCNICGNDFLITPLSLLNGHGCHKCAKKSHREKVTKKQDLFISECEKVHKNYNNEPLYDYSKTDYKGTNYSIIVTCKKCGKDFLQRAGHHLNGCGCTNCIKSKGEIYIENILISNNIKYNSQHRFKNCRNKLPLPFDFYLPFYNICIEYDGIYHYEVKNKFGGFDRLITQKHNDEIKTNYCCDNNIKLFRIKYTDNLQTAVQDILNYIKNKYQK